MCACVRGWVRACVCVPACVHANTSTPSTNNKHGIERQQFHACDRSGGRAGCSSRWSTKLKMALLEGHTLRRTSCLRPAAGVTGTNGWHSAASIHHPAPWRSPAGCSPRRHLAVLHCWMTAGWLVLAITGMRSCSIHMRVCLCRTTTQLCHPPLLSGLAGLITAGHGTQRPGNETRIPGPGSVP